LFAAQELAEPGDILLLHGGDYGKFEFEKSGEPRMYIAWRSAGDGEAIFSAIRVNANHLWFDDRR
jgi:hypothetical protein